MTTPDIPTLSKRFCELTGIKFTPGYESMDFHTKGDWINCEPDFRDAREVLKVMRKRGDFLKFVEYLGKFSTDGVSYDVTYDVQCIIDLILDTTGLLLKEAVEWMEGRE